MSMNKSVAKATKLGGATSLLAFNSDLLQGIAFSSKPLFMSELREVLSQPSAVHGGASLPEAEVVLAMEAIQDPVSLFEPVFQEGGDAVCVMDQVRDAKVSENE